MTTFECDVVEFRPNSILVTSTEVLPFRSGALIEVANVVLDGEVVFAQDGKLALTFRTVPEIFEAIEVVESDASSQDVIKDEAVDDAIDDALAEFTTSELVLSDVEQAMIQANVVADIAIVRDGVLRADESIDEALWIATLLAGRPIIARIDGVISKTVMLRLDDASIPLTASPQPGEWFALTLAKGDKVLRALAHDARTSLVALLEGGPAVPDAPTFAADGSTVVFETLEHYDREFQSNLKNGALVVRSGPMPVGHEQLVTLSVPGRSPKEMAAVVTFIGDGIVGFTVEPVEKKQTGDIVHGEKRWRLTTDVNTLLQKDGHTYFAVLQDLLAATGRFTVVFEGDGEQVELWIDEGRVVFTTLRPEREDDKIGRRLVAGRAVHRTALTSAMDASSTAPIGTKLTAAGRLRPKELHRYLRAQAIDRAIVPALWSQGHATFGPWHEPKIEGGLLPVSSGAIVADLVRRVVQTTAHDTLREALAPYAQEAVRIDQTAIGTSFRLRDKELRVLERLAQETMTVEMFLRVGGLRPLEASTLIVLGVALGFIHLSHSAADIRATTTTDDLARNAELTSRLERLTDANHFDVLEVHWTASHQEIIASYKRLEASVSVAHKDRETRQLLGQIRARIVEAFEVVGKRTTRVTYRNALFDEGERQDAAAHLIEQAEIEAIREDATTVERLLDAAEELGPSKSITRLRERLRTMQADRL